MTTILLASVGSFLLGALFFHLRYLKAQSENRFLNEKLALQEKYHREADETLQLKLKELSREIIVDQTKRFREDSLRGMELVLNPFREKMSDFSRKVEEMHLQETKDRLKLHSEIERIVLTGQKMSLETENLTRALKGDVKLQGNWGELILEKILEASGLREGEEFTLQGKSLNLRNEEGKLSLPDVIINLPDEKHLIVDSKVSLVAYERFVNEGREEDLADFMASLKGHIRNLSGKNYQLLDKLTTPDYVMLFIPIEGAFMLSLQRDREILSYAWDRNVVLVSPSTLLATLRTVASLWKQEKQTKNALEIARQAGALYDKFKGVTDDLEAIQGQIRRVGDSFEALRGKMVSGKGSLASRMENLRELGAKTSKSLCITELNQ